MAPSLVQSVAGNHTGANTATVVVNITATQAGNLLVIYAIGSQITAVTYAVSVTGGTTQTFTVWPNSPNAAQTGLNLNCWYVLSCAAGTTQITITRSSGTGQSAVIAEEWTGGTFGVGVGATASGTLTTTEVSGTTASQTVDLVLACITDSLGTSQPTLSTPTNGFTAQTFATGDNAPTNTAFKGLQSLNKITSSTGTFSTGMTASVTPDAYAGMILGFTVSGGGGGGGGAGFAPGPMFWRARGQVEPAGFGPWLRRLPRIGTDYLLRGLQVVFSTQNFITGTGGNNSPEIDVEWIDGNGNGVRLGIVIAYGGMIVSPIFQIAGGQIDNTLNGQGGSQTSLSTSGPDGNFHTYTNKGGTFLGSESSPFTLTELGPIGSVVRRSYQGLCPTAGNDANGFTHSAWAHIWPGDPIVLAMEYIDTNPGSSISGMGTGGSDAWEFAFIGGLTQVLQGPGSGVVAWVPTNGHYGTVGGADTAGWPSALTAGDPDYVWITPDPASGLQMGMVSVRKDLVTAGPAGLTNPQFQYLTNANRLKIKTQGDLATWPAGAAKSTRVVHFFKRNLVQADAISMSADYLNPDGPGIVMDGSPQSTFFHYQKTAYQFQVAQTQRVVFKHTLGSPAAVTTRWLCQYEISGWTDPTVAAVIMSGVVLRPNIDYVAYVDQANSIAYVKLMGSIVASGANGGQFNNGTIIIQGPSIGPTPPVGSFVPSALFWVRQEGVGGTTLKRFRELAYAPPASAANAFTQGLSAGLSFTGPTNLKAATNKTLVGAVLSFVGPTNLKNAIAKVLTPAGLGFVGAQSRAIGTHLNAGLSFTGAQTRAITKGLVAAGLSFTGAIASGKFLHSNPTAGLSFTGAIAAGKQFQRALSAGLSFTGVTNLRNAITKGMTAGLGFTGAQGRAITKGMTSGLTFTGTQARAVRTQLVAAGLGFAGSLAAGRQYVRGLTGGLSFSGAIAHNNVLHAVMTAALAFVGAQGRAITKNLTAGVSFAGVQRRAMATGLAAGLSFAGSRAVRVGHNLTASLGLSGLLGRGRNIPLVGGALGFLGNLLGNRISIPSAREPITMVGTDNALDMAAPNASTKVAGKDTDLTMIGGGRNPLQ